MKIKCELVKAGIPTINDRQGSQVWQQYLRKYRELDGWYYGNKKQFEQRHNDLSNWIDRAIECAETKGVKMP